VKAYLGFHVNFEIKLLCQKCLDRDRRNYQVDKQHLCWSFTGRAL